MTCFVKNVSCAEMTGGRRGGGLFVLTGHVVLLLPEEVAGFFVEMLFPVLAAILDLGGVRRKAANVRNKLISELERIEVFVCC